MRYIVAGLGAFSALAPVAAMVLWGTGNFVLAILSMAMTIAVWLLTIIVTTAVIVSWWTHKTILAGAELAIQAQGINDQWDAKKTAALSALVREGIKVNRSDEPLPALPENATSWLPPLEDFENTAGPESKPVAPGPNFAAWLAAQRPADIQLKQQSEYFNTEQSCED